MIPSRIHPRNPPVSHLSSTKATCMTVLVLLQVWASGSNGSMHFRQRWLRKHRILPALAALAAAGRQATHGSIIEKATSARHL
ncbi:hypothetical protein EDB81DRAFT_298200 [Dactylonectria macrodidyma]|uniref:Uncharacterized protein n=1 Tax=Dactylonectria macrodidyma TaxID=307937 RepID=A0A9P9D950_9HYPO|nr:hypothetical protein EDB81DRAFT_298200 [Dactylonectria macrodidyma]